MVTVISHPSPNADSRQNTDISLLVLHYTGMQTAKAALDRLCDPEAKVSAHYVVDEDGAVYGLVPEGLRAWHAGVSHWGGISAVNAASIGIEIVNPGHEFGYRPFPEVQMQAVRDLCVEILDRNSGIAPHCVVGHSDVAPSRKQDPGELFDWAYLAQAGVGLWPELSALDEASVAMLREQWHLPAFMRQGDSGNAVAILQRQLAELGYGIEQNAIFDAATHAVVEAFQRHWRQDAVNGVWDVSCQTRLETLLCFV